MAAMAAYVVGERKGSHGSPAAMEARQPWQPMSRLSVGSSVQRTAPLLKTDSEEPADPRSGGDDGDASDSSSDVEMRESGSDRRPLGSSVRRRLGAAIGLTALLALAAVALPAPASQGQPSSKVRHGLGGPVMFKANEEPTVELVGGVGDPQYYNATDDEPHCSIKDLRFLDALAAAGGDDAQAFFESAGNCGRSTVSLGFFSVGWHADTWIPCMRDAFPAISARCLTCYSDNGDYGLHNCAFQCMPSWCGAGCLDCGNAYQARLSTCVRRTEQELPRPKKCCLNTFAQWSTDAC
mmetsp:Transcript_45321/g.119746  ORF Transcript_45321/g.119746 Transcript_45321/m.119746 type:complete len:295 (-) Transcript_45321:54-938(-)